MPYIEKYLRQRIFPILDRGTHFLDMDEVRNTGDLNFVFSTLIEAYRERHGDSYATFSSIRAALTDARDEFSRRVVDPYEDYKIHQNGDVYRSVEDAIFKKEIEGRPLD